MTPNFFLRKLSYLPEEHLVAPDKSWKGKRLTQRLIFEQSSGLLPTLLRHADRNSMRWSIESRVPFLTPALSAISRRVPEEFLLSQQGVTKHLLRQALRGLVPDSVIDRRDKIGFETPQIDWLSEMLRNKEEVLDGIKAIEFLDTTKTKNFLLTNPLDPSFDSHLMWRTFNLIRWSQLTFGN
jgi:asparagine synthase (glutamine-hydrolysing)